MSGVYRWSDLTSNELAVLADDNAVAVRPLGAIEQHGPHLPLSADVEIAEGLLDAAWHGCAGMQPTTGGHCSCC